MSKLSVYVDNTYFGTIPQSDDYEDVTRDIFDLVQANQSNADQIIIVYADAEDNPVAVTAFESANLEETNEEESNKEFSFVELPQAEGKEASEIRTAYVFTDPEIYERFEEELTSNLQPVFPPMSFDPASEEWEIWQYQEQEREEKLHDLADEIRDLIEPEPETY